MYLQTVCLFPSLSVHPAISHNSTIQPKHSDHYSNRKFINNPYTDPWVSVKLQVTILIVTNTIQEI